MQFIQRGVDMLPSTYKYLEERGTVPPLENTAQITAFGDLSDTISEKVNNLVDQGKSALSDILTGVGKVIDKYAPSILAGMASAQFRGTQGSFMSYCYPIRLQYRFFTIAPNRYNEIGYPLHEYKTLNTLSGFA